LGKLTRQCGEQHHEDQTQRDFHGCPHPADRVQLLDRRQAERIPGLLFVFRAQVQPLHDGKGQHDPTKHADNGRDKVGCESPNIQGFGSKDQRHSEQHQLYDHRHHQGDTGDHAEERVQGRAD
jgi:hypothetical protein